MIYLIGGPPRCGKTLLTRTLSQKLHIPYVPADYLMSVVSPYIPKEKQREQLPRWYAREKTERSNNRLYAAYTPKEIVDMYLKEAKTYWPGIKNFILYALHDKQDFILEGGQLRPDLVHALLRTEGQKHFSIAFLYKSGETTVQGLKAHTDPNDWTRNDTSEETYHRIAQMINMFSETIITKCAEYALPTHDMSKDFHARVEQLAEKLANEK